MAVDKAGNLPIIILMRATIIYTFAIAFAAVGLLPACGLDLRDYRTVQTLPAPGAHDEPERLTINEAWQHIEDSDAAYVKWRDRYAKEITKREAPIAFVEGVVSAGLPAIVGEIGQVAGPFAPLVTLLIGRAMKRRKDASPEEVKAIELKHANTLRKEKQDSYNAGIEAGKALVAVVGNPES